MGSGSGHCPACGKILSDLFVPERAAPAIDQRELLLKDADRHQVDLARYQAIPNTRNLVRLLLAEGMHLGHCPASTDYDLVTSWALFALRYWLLRTGPLRLVVSTR